MSLSVKYPCHHTEGAGAGGGGGGGGGRPRGGAANAGGAPRGLANTGGGAPGCIGGGGGPSAAAGFVARLLSFVARDLHGHNVVVGTASGLALTALSPLTSP